MSRFQVTENESSMYWDAEVCEKREDGFLHPICECNKADATRIADALNRDINAELLAALEQLLDSHLAWVNSEKMATSGEEFTRDQALQELPEAAAAQAAIDAAKGGAT